VITKTFPEQNIEELNPLNYRAIFGHISNWNQWLWTKNLLSVKQVRMYYGSGTVKGKGKDRYSSS